MGIIPHTSPSILPEGVSQGAQKSAYGGHQGNPGDHPGHCLVRAPPLGGKKG